MKTNLFFLSVLLSLSQIFSFVKGQSLYGTTLVGVQVEFYDYSGNLLSKDTSDVHCIWSINEERSQLHYAEYLSDGSVYRKIQFAIVSSYENKEVRNLIVQHQQDVFSMIFWKDGSLIAYEFQDEVALFTGEIEY